MASFLVWKKLVSSSLVPNLRLIRPAATAPSVSRFFNTNAFREFDDGEDGRSIDVDRRSGSGLSCRRGELFLGDVFDPFWPMSRLLNTMCQVMDNPFLTLPVGMGAGTRRGWEALETDDAPNLHIDMPGLDKENVKVQVMDNPFLTLPGGTGAGTRRGWEAGETYDAPNLHIDMPGLDKENVKVQVLDNPFFTLPRGMGAGTRRGREARETDDALNLHVDTPGLDKENVKVQVMDNPSLNLPRGKGARRRRGWEARETDDALNLRIDVPGLDKENVKVSVEQNTLVIKGKVPKEFEDDEESGRRYSDRIDMPQKIYDTSQIKAVVKNGVLKVTVPKVKEEEREGVIQVQVE